MNRHQIASAVARSFNRLSYLLRNRPELRNKPMGELAKRDNTIGQAARIYLVLEKRSAKVGDGIQFEIASLMRSGQ